MIDIFLHTAFCYISGYFLRLPSQKGIIESKLMNIFMASKSLLKKVGVPFHEVPEHERGNLAYIKKKNPPSHVSVSILAKVHSDHFLSIKT